MIGSCSYRRLRKLFIDRIVAGFALFLVSGCLSSCVDVNDTVESVAKPVVQAYLIPGHPAEVNLWVESTFIDTDTTIDVSQLEVTFEVDGKPYILPPQGKGKYLKDDLLIEEGHTYSIHFNYDGDLISATTQIPSKPKGFTQSDTTIAVPTFSQELTEGFPDPILFSWQNPDQKYYIVFVEIDDPNPIQVNTTNFERPPFRFRNDPTQGTQYELRSQSLRYFAKYRVVLAEVTSDYAALYQQNGTSSVNIKTPFTNVNNGLGIFTGVNTDTLHIRARKF